MDLAETDKSGNLYVDLGEVRVTFIPNKIPTSNTVFTGKLVFQTYLHEDHSEKDGKQFVNGVMVVINEKRTLGSVAGELTLLSKAIRRKYY